MAQQQQQQSGDNAMAPVWITILVFASLFFVWKSWHQHVVSFVFFLNILQAKLITFFVAGTSLPNDIYAMQTINPASVEWGQLMEFTHRVGVYTRYPVMVILAILAVILYKSDITLKYRKTFSMSSLRSQEQYNWPAIMPVVKQDLIATDINTGPWAMALTPMEFARKYKLLKKNDVLLDNNSIPGQEFTAGIRRGDAKRVFTLQLGPAWDSFERCPGHVRALAAIFMARMHRDKDTASNLLSTFDKNYAEGKIDYSAANRVIVKYQKEEAVQLILNKHAYLLTIMASLLNAARDDGVVSSSEFLWLKTVDRRLWYMLNCVGRQTPYVEISGPFAHWKAENALGRRSLAPMIDEAIKALELAIKEVKLTPKELAGLES